MLAAWGALGTITLGALVGFFTVPGSAARNGILLTAHFRHLEQDARLCGPCASTVPIIQNVGQVMDAAVS